MITSWARTTNACIIPSYIIQQHDCGLTPCITCSRRNINRKANINKIIPRVYRSGRFKRHGRRARPWPHVTAAGKFKLRHLYLAAEKHPWKKRPLHVGDRPIYGSLTPARRSGKGLSAARRKATRSGGDSGPDRIIKRPLREKNRPSVMVPPRPRCSL